MTQQKSDMPLLTVSQLTQAIKLNLETMFPNIYLQGEISNLKIQSSGHVYFTLKDAHSQILAVMFKGQALSLKQVPKSGDHVMVKAELNVYPPKGNYQLIVKELSYMGLGELLQQLELLKIKLNRLGWFKSIHKKPLPKFPKRIGVVTSPTGAVIQDILNILTRRFAGFHLILNPVKVQGEGAAQEIAQAIQQFNAYDLADVLIVGRGGGSLEDLWAFNEEIVAEAIFNSRIPIISAVGHETDHCIADYVADVRAPTPSAAAEIVIAEKSQQLEFLQSIKKNMQQTVVHLIKKDRYRILGLARHPLLSQPHKMIEFRMQKLDEIKQDLIRSLLHCFQFKQQRLEALCRQTAVLKPTNQLAHFKQRLIDRQSVLNQTLLKQIEFFKQKLDRDLMLLNQSMRHHLAQKRNHLDVWRKARRLDQQINDLHQIKKEKLRTIQKLLEAFDPQNLLNKGYSILFAENESSIIKSIHDVRKGQTGTLLLSDGKIQITINGIERND